MATEKRTPLLRPKGSRDGKRTPLGNAILILLILYAIYLLVKSIAWVVIAAAVLVILYLVWKRASEQKN